MEYPLLLIYSEECFGIDVPSTKLVDGFAIFPARTSKHVRNYLSFLMKTQMLEFNDQYFEDNEDIDDNFEFLYLSTNEVTSVVNALGKHFVLNAYGTFPRNWFDNFDAYVIRNEYIKEHGL